jgi:hypothetical protein
MSNGSEHMPEWTRTCEEHGDTLVWENGGPRMPTVFGRWYCPTCHVLFMEALGGAS